MQCLETFPRKGMVLMEENEEQVIEIILTQPDGSEVKVFAI